MSTIPQEFELLYQRYFGTKPVVIVPQAQPFISDAKVPTYNNQTDAYTDKHSSKGSLLSTTYLGVEIWLPITFFQLPNDIGNNGTLFLPYATIEIGGSNDFIKTPMNLQRGTVKELFSMDDYTISIKGFFIDKMNRSFPEDDITNLKKIHESGSAFRIDNAIANIFLGDILNNNADHVVMTKFKMPEVEGGKKSMRPFTMELLSDSVFTLELA